MTLRRVEIPWSKIHAIVATHLRVNGIDPDKETTTWVKYENNSITLVYEQENEAPLKKEVVDEREREQKMSNRPAYLSRGNADKS